MAYKTYRPQKYYRYRILGVRFNSIMGRTEPTRTTDKFIFASSRKEAKSVIMAKHGLQNFKEYGGDKVVSLALFTRHKKYKKLQRKGKTFNHG